MKIAVLAGDGIGPEIVGQAVKVLKRLAVDGLKLEMEEAPFGGAGFDAHGDPLPASALKLAKEADAVLCGAVGGPKYDALPRPQRPEQGILRIRKECGSNLGANFDPSHFFWQGIDPIKAVRALEGAIHHVHAKDTGLYPINADTNGYLDTKPYSDEKNRSWIFRTVGYGHGADFWADFVSTLRMVGYDGTLSMEHEDSLMTPAEGLRKGVEFLQNIVIQQPKGKVTWA